MAKENMTAIAVNKSLLKEYSSNGVRTVFMDDRTEFQIKLFNPLTTRVSARIEIDGESLGNELILRPGETVWLERYFNKPNKFRFETYTVESGSVAVERAIRNNGVVKISFYKERPNVQIHIPEYRPGYRGIEPMLEPMCSKYFKGVPIELNTLSSSYNVSPIEADYRAATMDSYTGFKMNASTTNTKETGRVSEGSYSTQQFQTVDMDTEIIPFATETIKILPRSQKPYTKNDLEKVYCTNCGRKIKPKFKYCPFCGAKQ